LLPEQVEGDPGLLVRLRQDGGRRLLEDARAREVRRLGRDVGVTDAALGSGRLLLADAEVRDGGEEPALVRAEGATRRGLQ